MPESINITRIVKLNGNYVCLFYIVCFFKGVHMHSFSAVLSSYFFKTICFFFNKMVMWRIRFMVYNSQTVADIVMRWLRLPMDLQLYFKENDIESNVESKIKQYCLRKQKQKLTLFNWICLDKSKVGVKTPTNTKRLYYSYINISNGKQNST